MSLTSLTEPSTHTTRFIPPDEVPVTPARAKALQGHVDTLATLVSEAVMTNERLWDENSRLQAGIDRNLELVAELRGLQGVTEARARTAERLLNLVDPDLLGHSPDCETFAVSTRVCSCGALELRARIAAAKTRIRENLPIAGEPE